MPKNVDKRSNLYHDLELYQNYLYQSNKSESTIQSYLFAVRQYHKKYRKITSKNVQMYRAELIEEYSPQSANIRIRGLNNYFEFQELDITLKPMKVTRRMQLDKVISQADYEYLKRRLKEDEKYNYYYAIRFMAATGVRVSELVKTLVIDVKRGYKDIYSKGDKVRRIYIPKTLKAEILNWLDEEGRDHGKVFLNNIGDPMSESAVRRQLKVFSGLYQLDPERLYPHSFRHYFAKTFLEKCGDITLLSNLLGHESLETTRIYLRRSSNEQCKIVNKVVNW
ncbi:MAG: tyrosine-type recombinase/integrase [Enterocloster asparagiformis]|nr:tyrosine-type recombinase/integrase [Enterocloster asparagiformis]